MKRWFIGVVVLVPLCALEACSSDSPAGSTSAAMDASSPTADSDVTGDSGRTDDADGGTLARDVGSRFCSNTIGATITATAACCSPADKALSEYTTLVGAAGNLQTACGTSLDDSLAQGRVAYDRVSADACVAAFAAGLGNDVCHKDRFGSLEILKEGPCRTAIVGKQATGQPCAAQYECQDGLACVASAPGAEEGTCTPPPAVGRPCGAPESSKLNLRFGSHRSCALGSHCDPGIPACAAPSTGECEFDADCADGNLCILHKCSPRAKVGEACESPAQCNPGLFCDIVSGTSSGTCAVKKAAGAGCSQGFSECKGICPDVDAAPSCQSFCGSE